MNQCQFRQAMEVDLCVYHMCFHVCVHGYKVQQTQLVLSLKAYLLCASLDQVWRKHVSKTGDQTVHMMLINYSHTLSLLLFFHSGYLIRSKKASAGLTCSIFCCFPNSSFDPFPGWMMRTIIMPMKTAINVVVMQ